MLAILNMILMGDGSSNILNKDSLHDFDGKYGFGKTDEKFPATAFVLNPPYSAEGSIFVKSPIHDEQGLWQLSFKIQQEVEKQKNLTRRYFSKKYTACKYQNAYRFICWKTHVQTNIYVFRVGESQQKDEVVKFIDFSNDGYTRTNRKKGGKS